MGKIDIANSWGWGKMDNMGNDKQYDQDVYKRLELVQKQFKVNAAEQKKQQAAERRQKVMTYLAQNKARIIRYAVYAFLGILVLAVIGVAISGALSK
jgi:hypothetical protein